MISFFDNSLVSGVYLAVGLAVLVPAIWIAMRLRSHRIAAHRLDLDEKGEGHSARLPAIERDQSVAAGANRANFAALGRIQIDRLLRRDDFDFLAAQRGYKPEIGARLRRDRERILRLYVRELAGEFYRLHAQARELAAVSPEPHGDVVRTLLRLQLIFSVAMLRIDVTLGFGRLLRFVAGEHGPAKVELDSLRRCIETLRMDTIRLSPPAEAA